jgi:hypothetical protein
MVPVNTKPIRMPAMIHPFEICKRSLMKKVKRYGDVEA